MHHLIFGSPQNILAADIPYDLMIFKILTGSSSFRLNFERPQQNLNNSANLHCGFLHFLEWNGLRVHTGQTLLQPKFGSEYFACHKMYSSS